MPINFREELNEEQCAVVTMGDGPAVVIAGAGSGKTRTIIYRVAYLLEKGVLPEQIMLLTFTNKAAKEIVVRLENLLGSQYSGSSFHSMWAGTFHSVCNRILRQHGARLGFTPAFTILDHDDSRALIKACMKSIGVDMTSKRAPSPAVLQELIGYAKNAMRPLREVILEDRPSLNSFIDEIIAVAQMYTDRKREQNAMDFDDLLGYTLELVVIDDYLRGMLASKFKYVLVDEYQDTSPVQAELVRRLTGADGNLLVVGDDCQSIYAFRAADVRNILDFKKFHPKAQMYFLKSNYRSTNRIVSLANDIIEKNVDQYHKELVAVADKSLEAPHPVVSSFASANREAAFIADEIEKHLYAGKKPSELAVLFRATHHSQALEFELMKRGIAYEYRGGQRFFERSHVKDVLAFLRLSANVRDESAWMRTAVLWEGIGDTAASKIADAARASSAESLLKFVADGAMPKLGARASKGLMQFVALLGDVAKAATPSEAVKAILASSYPAYVEAEFPNAADRIADIEQLSSFSQRYKSIPEFLTDVTLDDSVATSSKTRSEAGQAVILSTIHQAKGLEWETVILMHLTTGNFPNRRSMDSHEELEEERRLFYVAVTRAKRNLHLTFPTSMGGGFGAGGGYGDFSFAQPSLFLTELSANVVQWKGGESSFSDDDMPKVAAPGLHNAWSSLGGPKTSATTSSSARKSPSDFWEEDSISVE